MTYVMHDTLCWHCNNSRKCIWAVDAKPVPGWNATREERNCFVSYDVKECPEFIPGPIVCDDYDMDGIEELRSAIALTTCQDYVESLKKSEKRKKKIATITAERDKKDRMLNEFTEELSVMKSDDEDYESIVTLCERLEKRVGEMNKTILNVTDENASDEENIRQITKFILSGETFCNIDSKKLLAALRYGRPIIKR